MVMFLGLRAISRAPPRVNEVEDTTPSKYTSVLLPLYVATIWCQFPSEISVFENPPPTPKVPDEF